MCGPASPTRRSSTRLTALLAKHRGVEIDAAYSAYDERPLEAPDEWGISRRSDAVRLRRDAAPRARRALVVRGTRDRSSARRRALPSEVLLEPGVDPVPLRSAVNLDLVESVSVGVLVERLGSLSVDRMEQVCVALAVAVACAA